MCPAYLRLRKGDKKKLVKYRKNDYPFLVNYEACRDCRSYFSSAMFGICIVLIHVCMYVFVSNMMIYNGDIVLCQFSFIQCPIVCYRDIPSLVEFTYIISSTYLLCCIIVFETLYNNLLE